MRISFERRLRISGFKRDKQFSACESILEASAGSVAHTTGVVLIIDGGQ